MKRLEVRVQAVVFCLISKKKKNCTLDKQQYESLPADIFLPPHAAVYIVQLYFVFKRRGKEEIMDFNIC